MDACRLSDKAEFPLFSRAISPDTSKGPALIAFMQQNIWKRIAIVCSTESIWFETRLGLARQLEAAGMQMFKTAAFVPGNFANATLSEIRRSGFRVMLVLSYDADAQLVASLAHREGMTTSGWAWLVSEERLTVPAMAGWLWLRPFLATQTLKVFAKHVSESSKSSFNIAISPDSVDLTHSAKLHDAIMLYAHAATTVLSEGGDLHDGAQTAAAVRKTTFVGVGGNAVALDSKGDLVESYEVMNYMIGNAEYRGMTFKASSTGLELQEYPGGYYFCSRYSEVAYTNESSVDACKDMCNDACWSLTYYAGLHTEFANHCYVFTSAAQCGALEAYKDRGRSAWSVPVGLYNRTQGEYKAYASVIVWPGGTMETPKDFLEGEDPWSVSARVADLYLMTLVASLQNISAQCPSSRQPPLIASTRTARFGSERVRSCGSTKSLPTSQSRLGLSHLHRPWKCHCPTTSPSMRLEITRSTCCGATVSGILVRAHCFASSRQIARAGTFSRGRDASSCVTPITFRGARSVRRLRTRRRV